MATTTQLQAMPQALPSKAAAAGRVFRIQYTATVPETSLSCSGTADVCFIANGNKAPPPACALYNATATQYDAMSCAY